MSDSKTFLDKSERSAKRLELLQYLLADEGIELAGLETIPRRGPSDMPPLSFAQERLWFLDQLEPGCPYHIPAAVRLSGALDVPTLERTLSAIVQRHETLRTTFALVDERPVQVIASQLRLPLLLIDLRALDIAAREDEMLRRAREEAQQPFDLAHGPLVRATLLRLADTEHVLLLTLHHIISDGWSLGILIEEVATLYEAFAGGRPAPLPALPIQYADFAIWQRQWLQGQVLQEQLAYWCRQFADDPPDLDLPTDRPHPPAPTFRGAAQTFTLPLALSDAVRKLSQREDATLFMTLLAAFRALLARYSAQDDIVIGTRIAGRTRSQTERLIGFFVNALALRTNLAGSATFRELLRQVRAVTLGAYTHQDLPFEQLVSALQHKRSLNRQPLFQVMFVVQNAPMPALALSGLSLCPIDIDSGTAKYDLDLSIREARDGQLVGLLEYSADLFDATTIRRMLDHFQTLLLGVVANPDWSVAATPILTDAERWQVLVTWNDTTADYPHDQCLHRLFEAQVARTPDAVSMVFDGRPSAAARRPQLADGNAAIYDPPSSILDSQHLTYRELEQRANQLAHYLQSCGVGPDVPVGVSIERSLELVVALLGIVKAGGAYVPLDPAYPTAHLAYVLAETRAPVLLTEQRLVSRLPQHSATVVCLDSEWQGIAQQSQANPATTVTPDTISHIMFTSGSTGQPKGVVVAQRQLLNRFAWMWRAYPFAEGEVLCQRTTVNFSISMWELLGALLRGTLTAVLSDSITQDPRQLILALDKHNVTRIVVVPSLLRAILDACADLQRPLSRLTLWSTCGEILPVELVQRFYERLPHAVLVNQYGASEMNDVACYDTRLQRGESLGVPIGRPIANTRFYILDRHLQQVAVGIPGELYVGSVGIARGYLNRPDLTAERFVPNPFAADTETRRPGDTETGDRAHTQSSVLSPQSSSRLYRTGDVARYRPDGVVEYLGRRDHQVKIRGMRVELEGIAAMLRQHPAVRQAVVMVWEDAPADMRLVAYVGLRTEAKGLSGDTSPTPSDAALSRQSAVLPALRTFLQARLPEYMLPASFVILETMPLTANGKIDRKSLPAPDGRSSTPEAQYVAPRNEIERNIAAVWQDVLRVQRVGVYDTFFDLGGHSLLIVQVRNRLELVLGRTIAIVELFQYPTVCSLAKHLSQQHEQPFSLEDIQEQAETHKAARKRRKQLRQQQH